MTQYPLFPDPPVVSAVVTVTVTAEHINRARAEGLHPVSLAILGAMPGIEDADVVSDGAYAWAGDIMTFLRFSPEGRAFTASWDRRRDAAPVTFTAEALRA